MSINKEQALGGKRLDLTKEIEATKVLVAFLNDLNAADEDSIAASIDSETNLNEAMEEAARRVMECQQLVMAITGHQAALDTRKARFMQMERNLRTAIAAALQVSGLRTKTLPSATVTLKRLPQQATTTDESVIPTKFWKEETTVKLDKRALERALKEGEVVPGAVLSNGGETIQIRS